MAMVFLINKKEKKTIIHITVNIWSLWNVRNYNQRNFLPLSLDTKEIKELLNCDKFRVIIENSQSKACKKKQSQAALFNVDNS